jgi:predicted RNA-binding protein
MPYRIDIQFFEANEIPIRPLIERLSFIEDKTHWGYPFRFGYLSIPEMDFKIIAEAMGRNFEKDFGE